MAGAFDNSVVEVTMPDIKWNRLDMSKYLAVRYSSKNILGKTKTSD